MASYSTLVISRDHDRQATRQALEEALAQQGRAAGMTVVFTPDLYYLPEASPVWERLRRSDGHTLYAAWLHPRPLYWLLARQGITCAAGEVLSLLAFPDAATCWAAIQAAAPATSGAAADDCEELTESTVTRWYPLLDSARCVNCGHCRQFCLFGVYALDAHGRVTVAQPDLCKPGCPACSRICPQGAIIFPRYAQDPRIAGAPGAYMTPDLAARKMYYTRTQQPCPQCGGSASQRLAARHDAAASRCLECGFPLMPSPALPAAFDDIDALIDALDRLTGEKG